MTATTELTTIEPPLIKTDSLGRIHVSREHRERLLEAFEQSGMSGVKFAEHCGVKYTTFASWVQKQKRARSQYPTATASPPKALISSLAEVTVAAPDFAAGSEAGENLTVDLPGGAVINITSPEQVQLAAALLNNLNDRSHA